MVGEIRPMPEGRMTLRCGRCGWSTNNPVVVGFAVYGHVICPRCGAKGPKADPAEPAPVDELGPPKMRDPGQEDRGTHYLVWFVKAAPNNSFDGAHQLESFNPFVGAVGFDKISVPIGWNLEPDPKYGLVMASLIRPPQGHRLIAQVCRLLALSGSHGFYHVGRWRYVRGPLRSTHDLGGEEPWPSLQESSP
jgi:hypothetical protein